MDSLLNGTRNTRCIIRDDYRFIRSDALTLLTEKDTAWLIGKNIRTVIDLRSEEEQDRRPCCLKDSDGFRFISLPVSGGNAVPETPDDVSRSYVEMCDEKMNKILDTILSANTGVIYFCGAGKDRTGVVSALLLRKLGFGDRYIIDDYMASKENLEPMLKKYAADDPKINVEVITPHERYMSEFLEKCPIKKERINLIFDCDGTLANSYGAITDTVCRLFSRHGIVCDAEDARRRALLNNVGYCIREIAEENGLSGDALVKEYADIDEALDLITLYDGAEEVLRDDSFSCFVYTHRGESIRYIFSRLGVINCFTEIVNANYHFARKPDSQGIDYIVGKYALDKSRTYYVGDRIIDIECGRNAGVGTVFFNSSGLNIDSSDADFAVSSLGEIKGLPIRQIKKTESERSL